MDQSTIDKLKELGRQACGNFAQRLNAGNAHDYAATTLAKFVFEPKVNGLPGIVAVMQRGKVDLGLLLSLEADELEVGRQAFVTGCYAWLADNPD